MVRPVRLSLLAAVVLAGAAPLALPARAASSEVPLAGCFQVTDPVGDVSDPDLDLVGVAFKTTPSSLKAYVRTNVLREAPRAGDAHRFSVAFTYRGSRFTMAASSSAHGSDHLRDADLAERTVGGRTQLYVGTGLVPTATSDLSAVFDLRNSLVVFDLPVRDVVRYGGAGWGTGLGSTLSDVKATSAVDAVATTFPGDSTADRGFAYFVGDNRCFGPAAAVLTVLSAAQSQYGDLAPVTARLTDASGKALGGRSVRVELAGSATTATTGSDGVLRTALSPGVVAGSYPLTLTYDGDATASRATVTRSYTVVTEATRLTLTNKSKRSDRWVLATLKDDDGTPLSGATVTFSFGGTTRSLVTSSKGLAELHDLAKGQDVTAVYDGVSGKWQGARATITVSGRGDDD